MSGVQATGHRPLNAAACVEHGDERKLEMNWMLIPSIAFVLGGLMMFARPEWGLSARRLERQTRGEHVPAKLIDEAVMSDMVLATALIIMGGLGIFGLVGPLDLFRR
jgi:hypothetical protein